MSKTVYTKDNSLNLDELNSNQIKNLQADVRVYFYCDSCKKLTIKRVGAFRKENLKLCRSCTMERHFGYRNSFQAPNFLEKKKKTLEQSYGSYENAYKEFRKKAEKTNQDRYGGPAPMCSKEIQSKKEETCLKQYGFRFAQQSEVVKKHCEQNNLQKWGFKSTAQNPAVKDKQLKTNLKKFGVPTPLMLSPKKIRYDNQLFDSKWELALWIYAKDHNEEIEREPCYFEYEFKGRLKRYYPDFRYQGILVDVKGDHFFENGKMICPYDRTKDELYQFKHGVALKHSVQFWTSEKMKPYLEYFNSKELGFKVKVIE